MHIYSWESLWIQTNIHKYAKFFKYIARLLTTKKYQDEFISSPKYINKDVKWSIESKRIHATRNNNISKSLPILGIYSLIASFTPPLVSICFLYLKYQSCPSKGINQHLIVLMKLPNASVKIRYRSSPCLNINVFTWVKGTFWLMSRQKSSTIGYTNIKMHREVDVFDYMSITYYHTW